MLSTVLPTHICVIATNKEDSVLLDGDHIQGSFKTPPTGSKFLAESAQEAHGKTAKHYVNCQRFSFYVDCRGLLPCKSIIDEATQLVILESLRHEILYLTHYSPSDNAYMTDILNSHVRNLQLSYYERSWYFSFNNFSFLTLQHLHLYTRKMPWNLAYKVYSALTRRFAKDCVGLRTLRRYAQCTA